MQTAPLVVMDYVGPGVAALVFVGVMSLVAEPTRRTLNAVILAGASGVYLSGGFGPWELIYPVVAGTASYLGLRSYRMIGLGWLLHAGWDTVHHFYGNPIWPFMPTSSFGCLVFDNPHEMATVKARIRSNVAPRVEAGHAWTAGQPDRG